MRIRTVFADALALVRRNALPLTGALAMLGAFVFFGILLPEAASFYNAVAPSSSWVVNEPGASFFIVLYLVIIAIVLAVGFVFVSGLLNMLVQSARSGDRGHIGHALTAFRRVGWLLLCGLIMAVAIPLLGALLVVPGIVALAFVVYAVPLIVDGRRRTWGALRDSVRMVLAHRVYREFVVVLVGSLVVFVTWGVVARGLVGTAWGLAWTPMDAGPLHGVAGLALTYEAIAGALLIALAVAVTCAVFVVLVAAMYVQAAHLGAVQAAAGQEGVDPAPSRPRTSSARRPLAVAGILVGLLAAATLFLWWIASPENDFFADHTVAAGTRVTLQSGLSLVVPAGSGWNAYNSTYRRYPSWLHVGENAPWGKDATGHMCADALEIYPDTKARRYGLVWAWSFYDARSSWFRRWSESAPVALTSADGSVQVRWKKGQHSIVVLTQIPGHMRGWLYFLPPHGPDSRPLTITRLRQELRRFWQEFSVQGAPLPAFKT